MNFRTLNDVVMTEAFESRFQVGTTGSGLAVSKTHTALTSLKVLADGPDGILKGDTIYVRGTASAEVWATKQVFDFGGQKVIFVPKHEVKLLERPSREGELRLPANDGKYHSTVVG